MADWSLPDRENSDSVNDLETVLDAVLTDAYGDDEQLWAFLQAFEDELRFPANAFVIGEAVSLLRVDYDGNERRG